tara:strand:+ start:1577 stop:2443 length:867 start_codon:yes stop_codon:yes gene_type:complete
VSYGKRITWLSDREQKNNNKQQTNKIILFDMDGTLTYPRKPFDQALTPSLIKLSQYADIGIVTGSDLDYVEQQLDFLLKHKILRRKLHLLPCNGTKYYKPPKHEYNDFELVSEVSMKDELDHNTFKNIMISLIESQAAIDLHHLPLSGHFISYRGSMINWCPIGRNANDEQRKYFVHYDTAHERTYRQQLKEQLERKLRHKSALKHITIKFGGSTSFDIYPNGWDKRYCLNHFQNCQAWFVGDKCEEGGNDQELYELLLDNNRSYKTKNTYETGLIIEEQIIPMLYNE